MYRMWFALRKVPWRVLSVDFVEFDVKEKHEEFVLDGFGSPAGLYQHAAAFEVFKDSLTLVRDLFNFVFIEVNSTEIC